MTQQNKIQLFEEKRVRTVWDDQQEKWYFSIVDVVEVLTDSTNPTDYLKKMRKRDLELHSYIGTNCPQIYFANKMSKKKIKTTPLKQIKRYNLDCQRVASSEKQVNNKINEKEMRKTVVIILSKTFPRTHERSGEPTFYQQQLLNEINNYDGSQVTIYPEGRELFIAGRKLHTIRANYDRWKLAIDKINDGKFRLSVRIWQGKAFRSPQGEITSFNKVGYQRISMNYDQNTDMIKIVVDGKAYKGDVAEIAKNDGLSLQDFKDWFFSESNGKTFFSGIIIHFTDFRY